MFKYKAIFKCWNLNQCELFKVSQYKAMWSCDFFLSNVLKGHAFKWSNCKKKKKFKNMHKFGIVRTGSLKKC